MIPICVQENNPYFFSGYYFLGVVSQGKATRSLTGFQILLSASNWTEQADWGAWQSGHPVVKQQSTRHFLLTSNEPSSRLSDLREAVKNVLADFVR